MDFKILYFLQSIRTDALDRFVVLFTNLMGEKGQIWLVIAGILLLFKKSRKMGITMLLSWCLSWVIGQDILKDLICRPRPCHIDETIELLIKRPSSYSCPSTHTALAFTSAISVLLNNKKAGILVLIVSLFVAFTRMYLFVHFPSDVLFGAIIGSLSAFICHKIINFLTKSK